MSAALFILILLIAKKVFLVNHHLSVSIQKFFFHMCPFNGTPLLAFSDFEIVK